MLAVEKKFKAFCQKHPIKTAQLMVLRKGETLSSNYGNIDNHSNIFIASATKTYIAATFMKLHQEERLNINTKITELLPNKTTNQLLTWKGKDITYKLTILHLLTNTSGLPDYFQSTINGKCLLKTLKQNIDQAWKFEDCLEWSKKLKPKFEVSNSSRAAYSDTNYQLLSEILVIFGSMSLNEMLAKEVFTPLGLKSTYVFEDEDDVKPWPFWNGDQVLHLPKAMKSFSGDGAMVSNAVEIMKFLTTFYSKDWIDHSQFEKMWSWKSIFFPFQYGLGQMKFDLPAILTLFKKSTLVGHSGLSGSFMFHCPQTDAYFTGTTNQLKDPSLPFRLMLELNNTFK